MTQLTKWLTDPMEAGHLSGLYTARVSGIQPLAQNIRLVYFSGLFSGACFRPGQEVRFLIDNCHTRHYALSGYNAIQDACSIVFYLHGKGPGSQWAAGLQTGDTVQFITEPPRLPYDDMATHHFFFGDETTLGLFDWHKKTALEKDHEYFGVLELHPEHECALQALRLLTDSVTPHPTQPAAHAIQWMKEMDPYCWHTWQKASFYLAGNTVSIEPFRQYLLDNGIGQGQIRIAPYWTGIPTAYSPNR